MSLELVIKKRTLFALSALISAVCVGIFALVYVIPSSQPQYVFSHTETVEVMSTYRARKRFNSNEAAITVKFSDGRVETLTVQSLKDIAQGQRLEVDVLEAEGENPRYRLAQGQNAP